MSEKKFNAEIICDLVKRMSDNLSPILEHVPEEKEPILNHLAAASIHLSLFLKDIVHEDRRIEEDSAQFIEKVDQFLEKCGCNYNEWKLKCSTH